MAKLKLTPELIEKLIPSIEAGNYIETVCQAHGISRNTYYLWLKKGESAKAKTIYRYFYDMVRWFIEFLEVGIIATFATR